MSGTRTRSEFIITCEHGGNRIPARYRWCFAAQEAVLQSHCGYDPGALAMAREMQRRFGARLFHASISRLVVDLNRSPRHPRLHAECILRLPAEDRQHIIDSHYLPFRRSVEAAIIRALARGERVVHVSSHSFTPELDGVVRTADIGLLYDPARPGEAAFCRDWRAGLKIAAPALRVRRNYPYRGTSDGFTTWLRRRFAGDAYIGIELEINQRLARAPTPAWPQYRAIVAGSLSQALARLGYSSLRSQ